MYTSSPDSQSRFQLPVFLSFRLTLLMPLSPTTIPESQVKTCTLIIVERWRGHNNHCTNSTVCSKVLFPVFLSFRLTLLMPLSPTTIHLPLRVLRHTTSCHMIIVERWRGHNNHCTNSTVCSKVLFFWSFLMVPCYEHQLSANLGHPEIASKYYLTKPTVQTVPRY
jgi:hypothetical protein